MGSNEKKLLAILIALLLPFVACGIQWLIWSLITPFVWFLFFPTAFFSSRIGGKAAGIVSTVISAFLVVYFFIPPQLSLTVENPSHFLSVAVFLMMGVLFSYTHDHLERASRGLIEAQAAEQAAYEQLQEDRIANLQAEQKQIANDLMISDARFKRLFNQAPVPLGLMTSGGSLAELNERFIRMFGYSHEEIPTLDEWLKVAYPDQAYRKQALDTWHNALEKAVATNGDIEAAEYIITCKDGSVRAVHISGIILGTSTLVTFSDITESKRANEEREAMLELLGICNTANRLPDLMQELMAFFHKMAGCDAIGLRLREGDDFPYYDVRGLSEEFVQAEKGLCAYTQPGQPARDESGKPVLECLCGAIICRRLGLPESNLTSSGSFWSNGTSETLATFNTSQMSTIRNRCNKEGYESIVLIPLRYHNETFGLFQFLDRRKKCFTPEKISLLENLVSHFAIALSKLKSDEALRESEQLNLQIISNAEEGIAVMGTDLRYRVWNPYMERLTGLSAHEALGRHPLELPPFLKTDNGIDRLENVLRNQVISTDEFPFHSIHNNNSGWVCDTVSSLRNTSGAITGIIRVVRDVTVQKKIEDELQKKNAEMEQFLYSTSHDLRTPLVTVKTFLGLLENDLAEGDDTQIAQDFRYIHGAADKMKLLLDELLELSRVGRIEASPVQVPLKQLVGEVLDVLAGIINESKAEIRLQESDVILSGDSHRLGKIWQNLIDNAIKYSHDNTPPRIELGVTQDSGGAVFFVRDYGIGVEPEYGERIFKLFEKLDPKSPGAGLGLSMVQRIVQNCGGKIWVESEGSGTGSSFCFTLPQAVLQS